MPNDPLPNFIDKLVLNIELDRNLLFEQQLVLMLVQLMVGIEQILLQGFNPAHGAGEYAFSGGPVLSRD